MASMQDTKTLGTERVSASDGVTDTDTDNLINASGHIQELPRNFSLLSAAATGITVGGVWPALGGSILTSLFNGGPPGVIYEFLVVSVFYFAVSASLAELCSAIPSAGGVYHWASITPGPRAGRIVGFFAGYWNWLAWVFGSASMSFIAANTIVQMYALTHTGFEPQPWHVFVTYTIVTWMASLFVGFGSKFLPYLNQIGLFFILVGLIVTIIVVTVMPGLPSGSGYATTSFVWREWENELGYSNGFVFVAGMLNGAYSVGAVDAVTHLCEEVAQPQRNVPLAILFQTVIGFVTGFVYLVAILYAVSDYAALPDSPFPLAEIYRQATNSTAGAIGLLTIFLICIACTLVGTYIDAGRVLWTLGRDNATPFPKAIGSINKTFNSPLTATLICGILVQILGAIYLGSKTAFGAFIGSFVLMTTASYTAAILPNLITRRDKYIIYGPFHMKGLMGYLVNGLACAYMIVWFVIYCFPFALPTSAESMNYGSLLWGGLTLFIGAWWLIGARRGYVGPTTNGGHLNREGMVIDDTTATHRIGGGGGGGGGGDQNHEYRDDKQTI